MRLQSSSHQGDYSRVRVPVATLSYAVSDVYLEFRLSAEFDSHQELAMYFTFRPRIMYEYNRQVKKHYRYYAALTAQKAPQPLSTQRNINM